MLERAQGVSRSAQEIQAWMIDRLARLTGLAPPELDPREPIQRYGLDSVALVAFATDLEEWVGYRFRSNPLEDHPTVEALAAFLADEMAKAAHQQEKHDDR
jgi:acyl carrier protein